MMAIIALVSDRSLTPKWTIFQLYHGKNKLYFNEMRFMSTLY